MAAGIMSNNANGLILAYDFTSNGVSKGIVVNNAAPNILNLNNPARYNATNSRAIITKDGTRYGQNNYINVVGESSCATLSNATTSVSNWTIATRLKFNGITNDISFVVSNATYTNFALGWLIPFYGGKFRLYLVSTYDFNFTPQLNTFYNLVVTCDGVNVYLYVNGVLNSFVTPASTSISISTISNGDGRRTINGLIQDFRYFNRAITQQEIRDYNNYFAKKIVTKDNFSLYAVNSTSFGPWLKTTSNTVIKESTATLTNFRMGKKYLSDNISLNGPIIQSSTAYGTWEFKFNPQSINTGQYAVVNMITNSKTYNASSSLGTYGIAFLCNAIAGKIDSISLYKGTTWYGGGGSSVIKNVSANFSQNTWYNIKITRNTLGLFTLYINGNIILTATDTTYTQSRYFGMGLYGIRNISDLKIKQGVVV